MTLADFLLARIAEDEAVANYGGTFVADPEPGLELWHFLGATRDGNHIGTLEPIARYDPARVLAECEAKRQLIGIDGSMNTSAGEEVRRILATAYADHPDFREEWRA